MRAYEAKYELERHQSARNKRYCLETILLPHKQTKKGAAQIFFHHSYVNFTRAIHPQAELYDPNHLKCADH